MNQRLIATYNDRWIGRGWPITTPMDIFLLGHNESLIYTSPVDSVEDLTARIAEEAAI
jgi:hypothetical protein